MPTTRSSSAQCCVRSFAVRVRKWSVATGRELKTGWPLSGASPGSRLRADRSARLPKHVDALGPAGLKVLSGSVSLASSTGPSARSSPSVLNGFAAAHRRHGSCCRVSGPRGPSMRCRCTGVGPYTLAGSLIASGALLVTTTPSPARAATAPFSDAERAAPVGALLADASRLVDWLRDRNPDVGAAAARVTQAESELAQSRLPPNPSLALSLSDVTVGSTNPPGLRFSDTSIYALTMSQTL